MMCWCIGWDCQVITPEMKATMAALRTKCVVGIVGGSDFVKINEQLAGEGEKQHFSSAEIAPSISATSSTH
jgi:hypothetical protein